MRVDKIVLLLLTGITGCTVNCKQIKQDPTAERCQLASVTPVSCAQPTRDNLLPHPDDCELFYYCVSRDESPVCRQCPARLHFNPRLHVCDHPESAGCRARPTPDSTTSVTFTETHMPTEDHWWTTTFGPNYRETATTPDDSGCPWWWC